MALVAVLMVSELPMPTIAAAASSPGNRTPPASTAAVPSVPAQASVAFASIPRPFAPNRAACELGVASACPSGKTTAAPASVTPLAGKLSSWTNLTPTAPGAPNPGGRNLAAMAYYPAGHDVILFGGLAGFLDLDQDTWAFANGTWTEVVNPSSCTATTCPSPRIGATLAYDPGTQSLILFGGLSFSGWLNDTWRFANDSWTNITASAGAAPPARYEAVMTYDPSDNYILLFGGLNNNSNALGDTWKFADGFWTNLTGSLTTSPAPRAGAAIAGSPDGYVMMFGGMDSTGNGSVTSIYQEPCNPGEAQVAWWFYQGKWSPQANYTTTCIAGPQSGSGDAPTPSVGGNPPWPCGRVGAALGWSPKNHRFVLYGGYGLAYYSSAGCSGRVTTLNDTWTYGLPSGGSIVWNNASSPPGPSARAFMGYASDFSDDYFEIFGGNTSAGLLLNETWRFYEIVYAKLTGPDSYNTGGGLVFQIPFIVLGYGGSGDLNYGFTVTNSRTTNRLTAGVCDWFYNASSTLLPFNGTVRIPCQPAPQDYGIYHLELTVTDEGNASHPTATANWTFTVIPPEKMVIYSEYSGVFYSNVNLENTFTIYAEVANDSPTSISATLGGQSLTFVQSSHPRWWNVTVNMANYSPGTTLQATASFSDWTENTSMYVRMVSTPAWLLTVFTATGARQSMQSQGAGPFNKSYTITDEYDWNLGGSTNFSINVPLVGGNYGLVPTVNVTFNATSAGNLSVLGTLSLTPPSIDIGPASLKVTVSFQLAGTFSVVGSTVQWGSATAAVQVSAALNASIPIYGFSLLGCNVGFTLQLSINPSITLDMVLAPLQAGGTQIIQGVALEIQKFLGSFSLALSAAINFGIGIASIGLGVGLSVAVAFQLNPFSVYAGWVNGSIFVSAQFLWWSDNFNIIGPATVYAWGAAGRLAPAADSFVGQSYNNGTSSKWVVQVEYYKASDYDGYSWNAAGSSGPAVTDIYPWTEVTGAAAYNGAYLFYTDNNVSLPYSYGLLISAAHLSSSTNRFSASRGPTDAADYELANPQAVALPDGNLYVLWTALPSSEASVTSPLNLTSMELQGAEFYPATDSWGSVRTYNTGEFVQSYQVSASASSGEVLELLADVPFLTNKAPEHLVLYNLTTGSVIANLSMDGVSEIVSFRASAALAVVESLGGNYSVLSLPSGSPVAISYSPPAGSSLISVEFATDSSSTLVLLYREATSSELVLYDTADATVLGALALGPDALQAEGIVGGNTTYVFVRSTAGIEGWADPTGSFANLTTISLPNVVTYGLVQAGSSIVVYAIVPTGGNATQPIRELELTELGASLASVPLPPGVTTGAGAAGPSNYTVYLVVVAAAVAVLLAVLAIWGRRRPPAPSEAPKPWAGVPPTTPAGESSPGPAPSPSPTVPPAAPPSG